MWTKAFAQMIFRCDKLASFAVQPLERRLHVKPGAWHTVAELSRSEDELPPQLAREFTVDGNAANHTTEGPANSRGHAIFLRRVGGRKLLGNARFQAILLERFARVFPSFVGTPTNDSATASNDS